MTRAALGRFTLLAILLPASLGGCVERGDFGRVKPSVWNDAVGQTGAIAARLRGEPVSASPVTDDEDELRNRAWRFLVPGRSRPWFDLALAELVATRVIPPDAVEPDVSAYHRGLMESEGRSPVSLYRKLSEDASADMRLIDPFGANAARVLAADRTRLSALARMADLDPDQAADARTRVVENRCLIAWVTSATAFRVTAYRYALDHLVIGAPQQDAVPTERAIARLRSERTRLDALGIRSLAACLGESEIVLWPAGRPVLVRKG